MHQFPVRVYYEDTDLAGIVYYANYLKFIERARSEWLRAVGVDQVAMKSEGLVFVVRRIEADYIAPARFDDNLTVHSSIHEMGAARITMCQKVRRGDQLLFSAVVTLVCITEAGRPVRLPKDVTSRFVDTESRCS
ncbi:tol-pal system-associated acyl-CoA thioesterase [Paracoccus aestuariivivens]|uniref:Tol-pal system-associated acyl-CoA thioesterase n=1 Tax=Paracoccus aestuariivivens TaxID=1820333 RepID=A0A6L6J802_9RHOB|nr:tol-pal system-associated acyl-CoA thioesterase [Paracoccus aestuariivivens]MTH77686.1 tol-pal system-associated acyl-CoA thioesterase [Paracoccus aestuariivivens]